MGGGAAMADLCKRRKAQEQVGRQSCGSLVNLRLDEGRGEAVEVGSSQVKAGLRGSFKGRFRSRVRPGRKARHGSRGG